MKSFSPSPQPSPPASGWRGGRRNFSELETTNSKLETFQDRESFVEKFHVTLGRG
jgi:hypothetical protein